MQDSEETKDEEKERKTGGLIGRDGFVEWLPPRFAKRDRLNTDEMIHRNAFSCVVFAFRIDNGRPVYRERVLATSARSLSCKLIPF